MEYQALYRKYRPKTFDDVYGQEIIVQTLKNIVKNNKLTHAYLFIGPRGTGKTSIAKIFAKTINCMNSQSGISCEKCEICESNNKNENVDIIEMDAASNNGVDEIREIKNHVTLLPNNSKYKIYIIDEVHMLTTGAFNALLKTLEEPPKHVIFILATTEPHKIPLTIISRCQSFEFKPIPNKIIKQRLQYICENENINIDEKSLDLISLDSNGGMRDAIGLLDQLNAYSDGNIKYNDVLLLNGRISIDEIKNIFDNIKNDNLKEALDNVENIDNSGKNLIYVCEDIIKFLRDELLKNDKSDIINLYGKDKTIKIIMLINNTINEMKNSKDKKIFFDILIINIFDLINKQTNVCKNKNIILLQEKKQIIKENEEIQIEKKDYKLYEELMNIRLNNILCCANKQNLINYKEMLFKLDVNISNLDQLRIINTIMECDVKAGSDDGIVLTTKIENILYDLWNDINIIDEIFSKICLKKIKTCILLDSIWNKKREVYVNKIKNKEKIEIIDESKIINEININSEKNDFDDLIEIGGD